MISAQRKSAIKELLFRDGTVKVSELTARFQVSEETIRRDLLGFEQEGLVKKIYGGAIVKEDLQRAVSRIPPVQQRKLSNLNEKEAIGMEAAKLVPDGSIILADAGSTVWSLICALKGKMGLSLITNSIDIAEECREEESWSVYVIGGQLRPKSLSLVGPGAIKELAGFHADFAFLGISGISAQQEFTSSDIFEAETKKAMVSAAAHVVVLADHTKFHRQGLTSFASFDQVETIVTSQLIPEDVYKSLSNNNVTVNRVALPSTSMRKQR